MLILENKFIILRVLKLWSSDSGRIDHSALLVQLYSTDVIHYSWVFVSSEWILRCVAFRAIKEISRQKEALSRDYTLLLFRMTSRALYSAQYHRQHCTLQAFEQFGALYMHNYDDIYLARLGFEPGTSRLQASVYTNHSSGRSCCEGYYTYIKKVTINIMYHRNRGSFLRCFFA